MALPGMPGADEEEIDPLTGLPRRAPLTFQADGGGGETDDEPTMVGPGPGGMMPVALPAKSIAETGAQTTRSKTIVSEGHKESTGKMEALAADQRKATDALVAGRKQQEAAERALAENQRQRAEAQAQLEADMVKRREEEANRSEALIAQKTAASEARMRDLEKSAKITTYWEDKGVAGELLAHFLTSLSDRSHALAGGQGPSPVAQIYAQKIAEDRERKLRTFETSKEFLKLAKEDQAAAEAAKKQKLLEIAEQHAINTGQLTKRFEALAARQLDPMAQAKAAQEIAEIKATGTKDLFAQQKDISAEKAAEDVKVTTEGPRTSITTNIAAPTAKGGKGPSARTAGTISDLEADINTADEVIKAIEKDPESFQEANRAYRDVQSDTENEKLNILGVPVGKFAGALSRGGSEAGIPGVRHPTDIGRNLRGNKAAQDIHLGLEKFKGLDPEAYAAIRSSQDPKAAVERLRERVQELKAKRGAMVSADSPEPTGPAISKSDAAANLIVALRSGGRGDIEAAVMQARAAGIAPAVIDNLTKNVQRRKEAR